MDRLFGPLAPEFARVTRTVLGTDAALSRPWPDGRLNPGGGPLEFAFGSAAGGLRYTMELGPPGTPPSARLRRAGAVLRELGEAPEAEGIGRAFPALQDDAALAWGAWLGARQDEGAPTRFKLYAEVAAGDRAAAEALCARYLPAPAGRPAVMVGAVPGSMRCEFYFERGRAAFPRDELRGLMARGGLAARADELAARVGGFDFQRGRAPGALPPAQYGFSWSLLPGGQAPVFSLFVFAADLAGGDAGVRRQVLAAARQPPGADLRAYAALSASLAASLTSSFHNMLSFSVDAHGPVHWQVALCPPPDIL